MRYLHSLCMLLVGVGTLTTLLVAGGPGVAHADKTTEALTADHIIACIKTAVAAQPALSKEVEAEYEGEQWLCEVKLVDDRGKRHKLHVGERHLSHVAVGSPTPRLTTCRGDTRPIPCHRRRDARL